MATRPNQFDTVALLREARELGLARGQVGAVVEPVEGDTALVEFADNQGRTIAIANLSVADLLVLSYEAVAAE